MQCVRCHVPGDNEELFPTPPGDHLGLHGFSEYLAHVSNDPVTNRVSECVVDALEVVDVYDGDAVFFILSIETFHELLRGAPIAQSSQLVDGGGIACFFEIGLQSLDPLAGLLETVLGLLGAFDHAKDRSLKGLSFDAGLDELAFLRQVARQLACRLTGFLYESHGRGSECRHLAFPFLGVVVFAGYAPDALIRVSSFSMALHHVIGIGLSDAELVLDVPVDLLHEAC